MTVKDELQDGHLEIDNNRSERSIKPFVIGRKNFLFANTPSGAMASAITYSIVETAKENGLNPFSYLEYLFEQLPNIDAESPEELTHYSPGPRPCLKPYATPRKNHSKISDPAGPSVGLLVALSI